MAGYRYKPRRRYAALRAAGRRYRPLKSRKYSRRALMGRRSYLIRRRGASFAGLRGLGEIFTRSRKRRGTRGGYYRSGGGLREYGAPTYGPRRARTKKPLTRAQKDRKNYLAKFRRARKKYGGGWMFR